MKTAAALKHYGSRRALAEAAGVTKQAVARWVKTGLVPEKFAVRLNVESAGKLAVNARDYTGTAVAAPPRFTGVS